MSKIPEREDWAALKVCVSMMCSLQDRETLTAPSHWKLLSIENTFHGRQLDPDKCLGTLGADTIRKGDGPFRRTITIELESDGKTS